MQSYEELQFVTNNHLAICISSGVEVHNVTREATRLLYTCTLSSDEWRRSFPCDVTVSESMPDSILVICWERSFVYQFPCHKSTQYAQRYQILDGNVNPKCIAANADTAVIGIWSETAMVICSLPGFTNQRKVRLDFLPCDLCITPDYLVVMGHAKMVVRSLGSIDQDVCELQPTDGWGFTAVSYRNDARQLYVACYHRKDGKGRVCKYTWDGNSTPQYVSNGCVIDDLWDVWHRGLSISSDGLLAVSSFHGSTKLLRLE